MGNACLLQSGQTIHRNAPAATTCTRRASLAACTIRCAVSLNLERFCTHPAKLFHWKW